jgi:cell division protein FtsZ
MGFDAEKMNPPGAKIKVFGIGGGGGNAVNTMIRANLEGVEFITANTDVQALRFSLAQQNIQIGKELTKGLGAGADPDVGRDAALEDRRDIETVLKDADMVFITAGMGGGTGTGGAAVIAQIARELGALTVAVVTKPFHFEGKRRRKHAELGIARLRESVDTLITIPNQRLLQIATPDLSMIDAFKMADNVLVNAVRGISDIINIPGTVNVDFADVKTVMSNMGHSLMGIGHASGPNRAAEAARMAISSPLLEDIDIQGATGILINITAGSSITLMEVNEACSIIQDSAHEDANIIFGAVIDENLGEAIRVTVIATGFPVDSSTEETSAPSIVRPVHTKIFSPDYATGGFSGAPVSRPVPENHATPAAPAPMEMPSFDNSTAVTQQAISEAQELAKWTINHLESEAPGHIEPAVTESSLPEFEEITSITQTESTTQDACVWEEEDFGDLEEEPVTSFSAPVEPATVNAVVTPPVAAPVTAPVEAATVEEANTESPDYAGDTASWIFDSSFDGEPLRQGASQEDAPIESFFEATGGLDITNEIDRKIDEALALAQKLRSAGATSRPQQVHNPVPPAAEPKIAGAEEDLDMPSFLRNGNSDITLD